MNQLQKKFEKDMPAGTGAVLYSLWEEFSALEIVWGLLLEFYGDSQERLDHLNASAPKFFELLSILLKREIFLAVSRLTDPPTTGGRRRRANASFAGLLKKLSEAGHPEFCGEIHSRLSSLQGISDRVREFRGKQLAHTTLPESHENPNNLLPEVTRGEMQALLDEVRSILGTIELRFCDSSTLTSVPLGRAAAMEIVSLLQAPERSGEK